MDGWELSCRYKYEELATPWVTNGVSAGEENSITRCAPMAPSAVADLISNTSKHTTKQVVTLAPITFRVERARDRQGLGTEVMEFAGLRIPNITQSIHLKVYLFFPQANASMGAECPEYLGSFNYNPHIGQATLNPKRVWRGAIGPKLLQLGLDYVDDIVVTIVQTSKPPGQNFTFATARIHYEDT